MHKLVTVNTDLINARFNYEKYTVLTKGEKRSIFKSLMMMIMTIGCIWLQCALLWRIREKVLKTWTDLQRLTIWPSGEPLWSVMNLLQDIVHHRVIKQNVSSGSSQRSHIPVMDSTPFKFSTCSWLQCLITDVMPSSVTLLHQQSASSFKLIQL